MRAVRCSCAVRCTRLASGRRRNSIGRRPRRSHSHRYARHRLDRYSLTGSSRAGQTGRPRGAASHAEPLLAALSSMVALRARPDSDRAGRICTVLASDAAVFGLRRARSGRELCLEGIHRGRCRATHTEPGAHGRRHPCPRGMARRTAPARRGTLATCCRGQDRADTLMADRLASTPSHRPGRLRSGCLRKFLGGGAERGLPRTRFSCVPLPSAL